MTDTPAAGGRWIRDPETGALSIPTAEAAPVADASETTALAPEVKPADKRKGAK